MKIRKAWVSTVTPDLSLRSKCSLLNVNRTHLYYRPTAPSCEVNLMNQIQDIYGLRPFQGYKRITQDLKDLGYSVNHKRVYRLMKKMKIEAIYPKKNLSKRRLKDSVYPYLLKTYPPQKPHDVWCTDITYIKTAKGFVYLTALIDVVSRCVMGFSVSAFLDTISCLNALEMALNTGYTPTIINSDQGCQYTSQEWVYSLSVLGIKISMDGKGRYLDNIPIERFWRTLKYEEVYLKTYDDLPQARTEVAHYIEWYNQKRRHSGLEGHRPYEVMKGHEKAKTWSFTPPNRYINNSVPLAHISKNTLTNTIFNPNFERKYSSTFTA